jgi:hypothetical protein
MEKYLKALADAVRIAVDKDYASDIVEFDLNGDWDGFYAKFEEVFGEPMFQ